MTPWLDDGDVQLYHGDVIDVLRQLPAGIAQTCITSPPYWGLRDYGTGEWTGGDAACDHTRHVPQHESSSSTLMRPDGSGRSGQVATIPFRDVCGRCGARRVDSQLGLEASPSEYVERLVVVFREVWRVLADTGTVWCNLGDSFLPGKQLAGIPWRVAFALQTDGWYLRSDIIWNKPNPMPESVTDRPTKAHEYLFLLAKRPRYYFDQDAIREPAEWAVWGGRNGQKYEDAPSRARISGVSTKAELEAMRAAGRNRRSVWTIPTEPFPQAHFATYPQALVRPCILAGTSEHGECSNCGAPWVREVEREASTNGRVGGDANWHKIHQGNGRAGGFYDARAETTGWRAACTCAAPTQPQTVLDPFIGSGTTALVARNHGRRCIGIDLSAEYLAIAAKRLQQLSLLGDMA